MNKPNSTLLVSPSEHQQFRMIIDYFGLSVNEKKNRILSILDWVRGWLSHK